MNGRPPSFQCVLSFCPAEGSGESEKLLRLPKPTPENKVKKEGKYHHENAHFDVGMIATAGLLSVARERASAQLPVCPPFCPAKAPVKAKTAPVAKPTPENKVKKEGK